ncbi:TPA: hypothetical protein ACKP5U_003274 [Pseudomonas aeruginosa]|uniref:hypothetical protein n=1 Tax=Pseudomonas TaxID=286 RepID=UPI00115F17DA|nr:MULTISPECIES: hypothetical protein [Pseudomonas]KAB5413549.1 hypothetical protein F8132_04090 [Pseudomonas aeruginosa]MBG7550573.1 hypothetical protein [Pseudomonas aeruginosa]MCU9031667.1 hypothetical protein [Pseudomonas aeruginosa]TRM10050.1 hypothetical protein FNL64_01620 [Pseudomonas aeruginosa]HBN8139288.1 hypothetical protein [Pseudomonas aeruginosa]
MTTPIVQSISDEQLAELEEYCHKRAFVCCGNFKSGAEYMSAREEVCCNEPVLTDVNINTPAEEILGLIARLRAAEADAKRYRWLCASAWYVGPEPCGDTEAVSWHDHNETMDGVTEAIDKAIAMERTP